MVLSLDIGLKRIGVAKLLNGIVVPSIPIIRKNRRDAITKVLDILYLNSVDTLVVGIPSSNDMQIKIRFFINELNFGGDIFFINEDFSSIESKNITNGRLNRKKDGKIDSIAAQIILQRWLNEKTR